MSLFKDEGEGLTAEALSTLQVKMLEANTIPKLLPLEIQEVDFRIKLLYRLAAKRMLAQVIRVEGLSKLHFAKLMYAIVCALEESKNYMLHETGFVLRDNFIFIGADWSDVFLTYVPMMESCEEEDVITSLKGLIRQIAVNIIDDEKKELETYLDSMLLIQSLQELKANLRELMDGKSNVQEGLPKPLWKQNTLNQSTSLKSPLDETSLLHNPIVEVHTANTSQRISFTPLPQKSQTLVLASGILAAAFLWQNYVSFPSTSKLHLTLGMTILLVDIWFVSKFLGLPRYQHDEAKRQVSTSYHAESQSENKSDVIPELQDKSVDIQSHYQNLHMHTTLIQNKEHNATVFLGNLKNKTQGPRLELQVQGTSKSVLILNDPFTIGRGDTHIKVDCVLDEAGVSRVHAEITKSDGGYELKDAGSTNGTCLNGEPLVTYQPYLLKDGDEIRILRQEMIFRY
nr:DUF6382 domain-containing protein [Paenibacillus aceris]